MLNMEDNNTVTTKTNIAIGTSLVFMSTINWLLAYLAAGYVLIWLGIIPVEFTNIAKLALTFILFKPVASFLNTGLLFLSMVMSGIADLLIK